MPRTQRLHCCRDVKDSIRKLDEPRLSPAARPLRRVVAALILRGEGPTREIFICQRRAGQPMGLKWEFPGGKIEPDETSEEALARELDEELAIHATIGPSITTITPHLPQRRRHRNRILPRPRLPGRARQSHLPADALDPLLRPPRLRLPLRRPNPHPRPRRRQTPLAFFAFALAFLAVIPQRRNLLL